MKKVDIKEKMRQTAEIDMLNMLQTDSMKINHFQITDKKEAEKIRRAAGGKEYRQAADRSKRFKMETAFLWFLCLVLIVLTVWEGLRI